MSGPHGGWVIVLRQDYAGHAALSSATVPGMYAKDVLHRNVTFYQNALWVIEFDDGMDHRDAWRCPTSMMAWDVER